MPNGGGTGMKEEGEMTGETGGEDSLDGFRRTTLPVEAVEMSEQAVPVNRVTSP